MSRLSWPVILLSKSRRTLETNTNSQSQWPRPIKCTMFSRYAADCRDFALTLHFVKLLRRGAQVGKMRASVLATQRYAHLYVPVWYCVLDVTCSNHCPILPSRPNARNLSRKPYSNRPYAHIRTAQTHACIHIDIMGGWEGRYAGADKAKNQGLNGKDREAGHAAFVHRYYHIPLRAENTARPSAVT